MNRKFSEVFKQLRKEKNFSQRELADALGISGSSVAMYESGKREPNIETLEEFADYFNVDIQYLLGKAVIRNQSVEGMFSEGAKVMKIIGREASKMTQEETDRMLTLLQVAFEGKFINEDEEL